MLFYSEPETRELRLKVEDIVLVWHGVMKKMMFGAQSYWVGKTLSAIRLTGGILLTRLSEEGKMHLLEDPHAGYFEDHGRVMKKMGHHHAVKSIGIRTLPPVPPVELRDSPEIIVKGIVGSFGRTFLRMPSGRDFFS